MCRIVDVWMALELALCAAALVPIGVLVVVLLGATVFRGPAPATHSQSSQFLGTTLFIILLLTAIVAAVIAFRAAYKGVIFDPRSRTLEMPDSNEDRSLLDVITQRILWKHFFRETIAVDQIEGISNQRYSGRAWGLNLVGQFGTRTVYFRSKAKRDELRALLVAVLRSVRQDVAVDIDV
jgi:heme/copper-type cytochrome/quinol oxidase subunit 2